MLSVAHLGTLPHVPPGVGVSQAVLVTGVGQGDSTVGSLAASQSEGRVGETLHAPGHHHTAVAQTQLGSGETDCLETTGTDLVNGGAGRPHLQPRTQGCLACRGLAQAGLRRISVRLEDQDLCGSYLDDAAHEHLLNFTGINIGNVQARLDSGAAQLCSFEFLTLSH